MEFLHSWTWTRNLLLKGWGIPSTSRWSPTYIHSVITFWFHICFLVMEFWDSYLVLYFFGLCSVAMPMVTRETQSISQVHYLFNQTKWIKCLKSTIVVSRKLHDEQGSRRQEQAKAKLKWCQEQPILFTLLVWDRGSLRIIYTDLCTVLEVIVIVIYRKFS